MPRFSNEQLISKALQALEEIEEQYRDEPAPKSKALRFILAFLASQAGDDKDFIDLWRSLTTPPESADDADVFGRWQHVNADMNGIYRALGLTRP